VAFSDSNSGAIRTDRRIENVAWLNWTAPIQLRIHILWNKLGLMK